MNHYTHPVVNGITYNATSQMTAMNYYQASETRTYNSMMQLTNIATTPPSGGTGLNITYNYTSGSNNGKISSTSDSISGETVTYQYDSLNRLISASGSTSGSTTWSQTQAYDGFGNLTGRTGSGAASGTTISTPVTAATNQLSSYTYDNNGNLLSTGYTYDAENRIEYANSGGVQYFYDGQNKRIWQTTCTSTCTPGSSWTLSAEVINMFGADGKQLASYAPSVPWNNTTTQLTVSFGIAAERAYFGGKLVAQLGSGGFLVSTIQDRLGSTGKYYPYGEERNSPPLANDQVKFATYTRDSATGNDYADQRYYSSALGRFMTTDPHNGSRSPSNPTSWNRYTYVLGDPTNHNDRRGLDPETPEQGPGDGDGGDGDDCWIVGFDENGDPEWDCADPGQSQPQQTSPPDPECEIKLDYRPIPNSLGSYHSYFYVTNAAGSGFVLEGEPEHDFSLTAPTAFGNLIAVDTPGTQGDPNHKGDNAVTNPNSGIVIGGQAVCDLVNQLIALTDNFGTAYQDLYKLGGPNSNSFAHWLANYANHFLDVLTNSTFNFFGKPPVSVPGWSINP